MAERLPCPDPECGGNLYQSPGMDKTECTDCLANWCVLPDDLLARLVRPTYDPSREKVVELDAVVLSREETESLAAAADGVVRALLIERYGMAETDGKELASRLRSALDGEHAE